MKKVAEIRKKIQELAKKEDFFSKRDLLEFFPEHKDLVSYALKTAVDAGTLEKRGRTRGATYVGVGFGPLPVDGSHIARSYVRGEISEDGIFHELRQDFLDHLSVSENTMSIVSYALTEMVNNAIDHSESQKIDVSMWLSDGILGFSVRDYGIGAFRSVKEKLDLPNERLAAAELTKGKVTTSPKWHSGEGIFFTSRAADRFRLTSGRLTMERTNDGDSELRIVDSDTEVDGTLVEFNVATDTPRRLSKDVFGQFESAPNEYDFGKTEIEVRLFGMGDVHVSRSQAKRIVSGLEKFKVVILDFGGVPFIGQGFADQIFRIFVREHPGTKLVVKNAVPDVQFMIDRVSR